MDERSFSGKWNSIMFPVFLCWLVFTGTAAVKAQNSLVAGLSQTYDRTDLTNLSSARVTGLTRLLPCLSAGIEVSVLKFWEGEYSSAGTGLSAALSTSEELTPGLGYFLLLSGGPVLMFPEYSSYSVNYSAQLSVCADIRVWKDHCFFIGPSVFHFSNGKPYAQSKNPMFDGLGLTAGIYFKR